MIDFPSDSPTAPTSLRPGARAGFLPLAVVLLVATVLVTGLLAGVTMGVIEPGTLGFALFFTVSATFWSGVRLLVNASSESAAAAAPLPSVRPADAGWTPHFHRPAVRAHADARAAERIEAGGFVRPLGATASRPHLVLTRTLGGVIVTHD